MKPRRPYTLLLVTKDPPQHVVTRTVMANTPRRALRQVEKQLVGIAVVHVLVGGSRVRTVKLEGAA